MFYRTANYLMSLLARGSEMFMSTAKPEQPVQPECTLSYTSAPGVTIPAGMFQRAMSMPIAMANDDDEIDDFDLIDATEVYDAKLPQSLDSIDSS